MLRFERSFLTDDAITTYGKATEVGFEPRARGAGVGRMSKPPKRLIAFNHRLSFEKYRNSIDRGVYKGPKGERIWRKV